MNSQMSEPLDDLDERRRLRKVAGLVYYPVLSNHEGIGTFMRLAHSVASVQDQLMLDVWKLVTQSPIHREWAVREIERLFWPPAMLNQMRVYADQETMQPKALVTWAYMPLSAIESMVHGKLKLEHKHWQGSRYWGTTQTIHTLIVDMIAVDRKCHAVVSNLRELFRGQTCFALRRNHGERRLAAFRGYDDVPLHASA